MYVFLDIGGDPATYEERCPGLALSCVVPHLIPRPGIGACGLLKLHPMPTPSIAVLRITLDDVEPKVMRRIAVPANIRLDRLHLVIQAVMGWTNSHLYEFRIGGAGWGIPDPDGIYDGPMDASKARLNAALTQPAARRSAISMTSATAGPIPSRSRRSCRRSRSGLLSSARSRRPMSARGLRRSAWLRETARNHRRSRTRGVRRNAHLVRRPVRSKPRRSPSPRSRPQSSSPPLEPALSRNSKAQNLARASKFPEPHRQGGLAS